MSELPVVDRKQWGSVLDGEGFSDLFDNYFDKERTRHADFVNIS